MNPLEIRNSPKNLESPKAERRTDLDLLRGVAMFLGILLHVSLSFFPSPWPVQDREQSQWCLVVYAVIHSFRMPLFFILSGFFTMYLFRRNGLGKMLRLRAFHILLPLILGVATIVPLQNALVRVAENQTRVVHEKQDALVEAILHGDVATAHRELLAHGPEWVDPRLGFTALYWASAVGVPDMVEMLLREGCDIHWQSKDGDTALFAAALFGNEQVVSLLLARGADPLAKDHIGRAVLYKSIALAKTAQGWAQVMGLPPLDERGLDARRPRCSEILAQAVSSRSPETFVSKLESAVLWYQQFLLSDRFSLSIGGSYFQVFTSKFFDHLWFLWLLVWLIVGFAIVVKLGYTPQGHGSWIWPVLTLIPQFFMTGFGAELWMGLIPPPHVVLFYGCFFWFGVEIFARDGMKTDLGRSWKILLPLGVFLFLPAAFVTLGEHILATFVQVGAAWLIALGVIGVFREFASSLSQNVRWFSDSTYWTYLAHVPLVVALQLAVAEQPWPVSLKFALVTAVSVALLLLSYQGFVRYTWVGTLLNGRRHRPGHSAV